MGVLFDYSYFYSSFDIYNDAPRAALSVKPDGCIVCRTTQFHIAGFCAASRAVSVQWVQSSLSIHKQLECLKIILVRRTHIARCTAKNGSLVDSGSRLACRVRKKHGMIEKTGILAKSRKRIDGGGSYQRREIQIPHRAHAGAENSY